MCFKKKEKKKKKRSNNGHFWFADMVCLRIVERGKWKVFRRIKYALFYSVQQEENKWWSSLGLSRLSVGVWFFFLGFDGGCRIYIWSQVIICNEKMKVLDFAGICCYFVPNAHLFFLPIKNITRHGLIFFLCCNNLNIFIFLTDTE